MFRRAFTMLELIFVIVVMGILSKFGVELFLKMYEGYARTIFWNDLQTKSAAAIQSIGNRLSYRIKDSVNGLGTNGITWVGYDMYGWKERAWSGIIDINNAGTDRTSFVSPGTTDCYDIDGAAGGTCSLFIIGGDVTTTGSNLYYPVAVSVNTIDPTPDFNPGDKIYEFYQLANSTYSLSLDDTTGFLEFRSNQTPGIAPVGTGIRMCDEVSQFLVSREGDGIHIHLCLERNILGEGLVETCKDKFVF